MAMVAVIHYHGTPITPQAKLRLLKGRHFCVSFARPENAALCLEIGQSVMWDNGAFSVHTRGETLDVLGYYYWLAPRLRHPHWAVVPDCIEGTVEDQRALIASWPYPRELGAPVWHLHEPLSFLLELAETWPRICFGSSAQYWKVGSSLWHRRITEAWDALTVRNLPTWVHMLRGFKTLDYDYPFASADSTNIGRNHVRNGCPLEMANRIDARQVPLHWRPSCS